MVTNTIARCQCWFLTLKLLLSAMLFEIPSTAFQNVVTVLSDHRHVASTCNGLQRQTFEIQALHCPGLHETKRPIHALICIQLIDEAASCGVIQRDKMRKRDLWRANSLVEIISTYHTDGGHAETDSRIAHSDFQCLDAGNECDDLFLHSKSKSCQVMKTGAICVEAVEVSMQCH